MKCLTEVTNCQEVPTYMHTTAVYDTEHMPVILELYEIYKESYKY